jgi:hypothetical protein
MLRTSRYLLCTLLLLSACAPITPTQRAESTASNTPGATRTPRSTPTRFQDIIVQEFVLKEGPSQDEISIHGMVKNLGREPLTDVQLLVQLLDGQGQLIQQKLVPIFLPHLKARSESPFSVTFKDAAEPKRVSIEVASYARIPVTPVALDPERWSLTPLVGGGAAVLGEIVNTSERTVALHRVGFLVLGPDGKLLELSQAAEHLSVLEPGEVTPFLAKLERRPEERQLKLYIDATASTIKKFPSDLSVHAAWLERTSQGAPFLLGEISNTGYTATWARLLAVLRVGGDLISVAPIDLPFPIPADESWPISAPYLPGLEEALLDGDVDFDDVELEVLVNTYMPPDVEGSPLMLQFQISHYEPIGSTLVMRGQVINSTEETVAAPTMYAALRSTSGALITAGWTRLDVSLDSGESVPFEMNLPLPKSASPANSEHDLLAIGFHLPDP